MSKYGLVLFPTPKLDTNPGSFIIFEWSLPGALALLICPAGVADRKTLTGLCQREMDRSTTLRAILKYASKIFSTSKIIYQM